MIRPAALFSVALLLLAAVPSISSAAFTNSDARIILHLTAPATKNQCISGITLPRCDQVVSQGLLYPAAYFAYVLVTNGDTQKGLAGLQLGINYDAAPHSGVDVLGWTLCATMNFASPEWPASGSGNMITWDPVNTCQRYEPTSGAGVMANAGYFYVAAYTPGDLEIIPRPVDGYAKVADCGAAESIVEGGGVAHVPPHLGYARFSSSGMDPGYSPCLNGAAPPLSCSISGPATVGQQSSASYTVTSSTGNAAFTWTISGNGSLGGMNFGPTVTVLAGNPGTFTLVANGYNGTNTCSCWKQVTITANPTCLVSGPGSLVVSTTQTYTVSSTSPGATFAWAITGNGSIVGSTTGPSVQVASTSSTGGIGLTVTVTSGGYSGTCTKDIAVIAAPECSISGPASVLQTATSTYTVSTTPGATGYAWSITGNGAITTSSTSTSVQVTAANPGSYVLTCNFTSSAGPGTCQKTVAVESSGGPTCIISGESEVVEGSANHQYQASTSYSGATFNWSIEGNGEITTGTTGSVIRVTAGAVGSFRVMLAVAAEGVNDSCGKTVIVDSTPRSTPGMNNNAKVMFHVLSPTTKNQCTRSSALPECNAVVAHGDLYPSFYYAYVLMNDGYTDGGYLSGIGGLEFGIDYDGAPHSGVDIYTWTACGTSETPTPGWPAPGSGNRVVWDPAAACQRYEPGGTGTGVVTTAGFLYMAAYSPGVLAIGLPPSGVVRVTDCQGYDSIIEGNGVQHTPSHLGQAGFGGAAGYNPCGVVMPVAHTTWSGLKALYR